MPVTVIDQSHGNTIVPAHGVAVLYAGNNLNYMTQRFTDAWGSGVTLIGVQGFTSLAANDAIGLWANRDDYKADMLPGTTSPRRTFQHAVTSLDFSEANGFPTAIDGRSYAWRGTGNISDGQNWDVSDTGTGGAFESTKTVLSSTQINSPNDLGNPNVVPAGAAASGLLISEIMYAPASPVVSEGFTEADFEWVELVNNTGATINFASTNYHLDDIAGSNLAGANVKSGTLAIGQSGVLFNSSKLTVADMVTMWGNGNYIPVTSWPSLNNSTGGDTIALWSTRSSYTGETITNGVRSHDNAVAAVSYDVRVSAGWPAISAGKSIFLEHLSDSPTDGGHWVRAGSSDDDLNSSMPLPLLDEVTDNPGGDIGSPGFAPGTIVVATPGDYNSNGAVDAADYTVWRDHFGQTFALPNEGSGVTSGSVTIEDYNFWKSHFGMTGSGATSVAVPEPTCSIMLVAALLCMWRWQSSSGQDGRAK